MTILLGILALIGCLLLVTMGEIVFNAVFESVFGKKADLVRLGVFWLFTGSLVALAVMITATSNEAGEIWLMWIFVGMWFSVIVIHVIVSRSSRPPRAHDPSRTRPD